MQNTDQAKLHHSAILAAKRSVYIVVATVCLLVIVLGFIGAALDSSEAFYAYLMMGVPAAVVILVIISMLFINVKNVLIVEKINAWAVIAYLIGWDIANLIMQRIPTNEFVISNTPIILLASLFLCLSIPQNKVTRSVMTLFFVHMALSWANMLQFPWSVAHASQLATDILTFAVMVTLTLLGTYSSLLAATQTEANEMRLMASTDPLTGLCNRRFMFELMSQRRRQIIIQIDLDFFKRINDDHGHDVGDEVLRRVAQLLYKIFTIRGDVARWGGEEFLVSLVNIDINYAIELAEAARHLVEKNTRQTSVPVTVSQGIAQQLDGESIDEVLKRADMMLYRAKERGRNCVKVDREGTMF